MAIKSCMIKSIVYCIVFIEAMIQENDTHLFLNFAYHIAIDLYFSKINDI